MSQLHLKLAPTLDQLSDRVYEGRVLSHIRSMFLLSIISSSVHRQTIYIITNTELSF